NPSAPLPTAAFPTIRCPVPCTRNPYLLLLERLPVTSTPVVPVAMLNPITPLTRLKPLFFFPKTTSSAVILTTSIGDPASNTVALAPSRDVIVTCLLSRIRQPHPAGGFSSKTP